MCESVVASLSKSLIEKKAKKKTFEKKKKKPLKMDLLGSILDNMDKPPTTTSNEAMKKQKQMAEKMRNREKEELNRFRKYVEERIARFLKTDERKSLQFQPLDKPYRSIVHDVAEVAGLVAMSFGQDGLDRYIVVYKKEHSPSEDEISARRDGAGWNEETAKEYAKKREEAQERLKLDNAKATEEVKPHTNYKDKYVHLIGQDAALEAAKKTQTNKTYGYVPSENKRDLRSIEQTMADIQAKKKLKTTQHDGL